jgi:hypothetical protein
VKRMRRDPVRFDVFAALAHYTSKHRLSIRDDNTVSKFLDEVRGTTTGSLSNDAFVYGFRVQAMFETVVASLGKVQLSQTGGRRNRLLRRGCGSRHPGLSHRAQRRNAAAR